MSANVFTYIARGTIKPCRIVTTDGGSLSVIQAGASPSVLPTGVSSEASRRAAGSAFDDGNAAITGEEIRVYQLGDLPVLCEIGSAVNGGDWLTSDVNGRGITATTGQFCVGQALEAGTTLAQRVWIKVQPTKI
jgi:hypothetical protein